MYNNKLIGDYPKAEYYKTAVGDMVKVPYDITEISPGLYSWRVVSVKPSNYNYDGVVSALISFKYSPSKMTATINNYLLDPEDEKHKQEFLEMQEYRKIAKATAKTIFADNK